MMTQINTPQDPTDPLAKDTATGSRDRIDQISHLFEAIRVLVVSKLEEEGPVTGTMIKTLLAKVGELQTAHLMVLQAEEKFHDKFEDHATGPGPDYDEIRREIGRALDRIRAASDADDVSGGSDT